MATICSRDRTAQAGDDVWAVANYNRMGDDSPGCSQIPAILVAVYFYHSYDPMRSNNAQVGRW